MKTTGFKNISFLLLVHCLLSGFNTQLIRKIFLILEKV